MHTCGNFPPYRYGALVCNETAKPFSYNYPTNTSCVDWNQYYTNCTQRGNNPFQGTISFDNIGLAWVAIFLVRYSIQDVSTVFIVDLVLTKTFALFVGNIVGRLDGYNVLCTGCSQLLGLDLLRFADSGKYKTNENNNKVIASYI